MNKDSETLLPGEELFQLGLADLSRNEMTDSALLVLIAAPRLKRLGITIPDQPLPRQPREHELYARLEARLGDGAHSHYNSLIRRIVSFARALERERSRE